MKQILAVTLAVLSSAVLVIGAGDPCRPETPQPKFRIDTFAGRSTVRPDIGDGGPALRAWLFHPTDLVFDAEGKNLYICDNSHNRIRRVSFVGDDPSTISTVVGTGAPGVGSPPQPVANGPAASTMLAQPMGIALDSQGNLFIADYANHVIRMVHDVISPSAVITTIAGSWSNGFVDATPATDGQLNFPNGVAVDASGTVWVADTDNNCIRRLTKQADATYGMITTVTSLVGPRAVLTDGVAGLYIANSIKHTIEKLIDNPRTTTVAGRGQDGFECGALGDPTESGPGPATSAFLFNPVGMALDGDQLYFADTNNHRIRKVDLATSTISMVAGPRKLSTLGECGESICLSDVTLPEAAGFSGDRKVAAGADGKGNNDVKLCYPCAVAVRPDADATKRDLYIADTGNHRIRRIRKSDGIIETVVGTDHGSKTLFDEGCPALDARFHFPAGVVADAGGNVFILDHAHNRVVRVSAEGMASTYAGTGVGEHSGDNGPALRARVGGPMAGIAIGKDGALYFNDDRTYVRRVSPDGVITTVAGCDAQCKDANGQVTDCKPFVAADGETKATSAMLGKLAGIALDGEDNVYIASPNHHGILKVTKATGNLSLWGGTGASGSEGDGIPVKDATFQSPYGLAWHDRNLYIADTDSRQVRRVDSDGNVHLVAGDGGQKDEKDGTCATNTGLWGLNVIALDSAGNLYISLSDVIRMVDASTHRIYTIAGIRGKSGYSGDAGKATRAQVWGIGGLAVDRNGNILIADTENNVIRVLSKLPD